MGLLWIKFSRPKINEYSSAMIVSRFQVLGQVRDIGDTYSNGGPQFVDMGRTAIIFGNYSYSLF